MSRRQYRLSIDEALYDATVAAAKATGVPHHVYIERALRLTLDPVAAIEDYSKLIASAALHLADTQDRINVIADYVVDRYREDNANETVSGR